MIETIKEAVWSIGDDGILFTPAIEILIVVLPWSVAATLFNFEQGS